MSLSHSECLPSLPTFGTLYFAHLKTLLLKSFSKGFYLVSLFFGIFFSLSGVFVAFTGVNFFLLLLFCFVFLSFSKAKFWDCDRHSSCLGLCELLPYLSTIKCLQNKGLGTRSFSPITKSPTFQVSFAFSSFFSKEWSSQTRMLPFKKRMLFLSCGTIFSSSL